MCSRYTPARSLNIGVALLTIFAAAEISQARAFEAAIRAPVGCVGGHPPCRSDISLEQAVKSADTVSKETIACIQEEQIKKSKKLEKGIEGLRETELPEPCLSMSATEEHICEENDATSYEWTTADTIFEGSKVLTSLRNKLKDGALFARKYTLVEASESKPDEQHIALCNVREINGNAGPPTNCGTVAIKTPTLVLLRKGLQRRFGLDSACRASATIRLGGTIDINFIVHTSDDIALISNSLNRMLRALGFSTIQNISQSPDKKFSEFSVQGTAPLRDSKILGAGWREAIDFDLFGSTNGNDFRVRGSAKPMVCRQASGLLVDYHGPDDAQRGIYASALNKSVAEAITHACTLFKYADDQKIICQ